MLMQKVIIILLFSFYTLHSLAQGHQNISAYIQAQYNQTIYSRTTGNNPWGAGIGVQTFFFKKSRLCPTIEITGDAYLADDKVLRLEPDGKPIDDISGMVNFFGGASYFPSKKIYLSLTSGASFINQEVFLGVKPSLGFYLSSHRRWTGRIAYINIFNPQKPSTRDFGSVSLSLGVKLF